MPVPFSPSRHRKRHGHGVGLAEIVHVEFVNDLDVRHRDSGLLDHAVRCTTGLDHAPVERGDVEIVEQIVQCLHLIVPDVGDDATERRGHARERRHDRAAQTDIADQRAGMQRAAAAERHRGEFRRIVAALDRDQPDRAGHARISDADDGLGGRHDIQAQRLADVRQNGVSRGLDIEPFELAADRPRRH